MKKNIKKILGVFLSVLLVIVPIISTNVEKVEAEEVEKSCETLTNYYFFLLVADPSTTFKGKLTDAEKAGSSTVKMTHNSAFLTDFPENRDESSAKPTWINIGNGQDGWTKEKWWDTFLKFDDLNGSGQVIPDSSNKNIRYYAHIQSWYLEGDEEKEGYVSPKSYSLQDNIDSTFTTSDSDGTINIFGFSSNPTMAIGITRTFNVASWKNFAAQQNDRYVNGQHPTNRNLWMPGLLKVTYDANCVEETPEFKLTINYLEEGTNMTLQDPKDGGTYAAGDTYNKTCDASITTADGTYTLTSNKNLTGTMPANDKDENCYYKLNEDEPILPPEEPEEDPTYKVTVNYIDEKTRQPLQDPKVTTGFKNGESYLEDCPDSLLNKTYIYDSFSGNLSGKIAGKDEVIYCIYTNENNKTSDIPIYIVWGVGGAALAYSIYYFRKYYKQENNA